MARTTSSRTIKLGGGIDVTFGSSRSMAVVGTFAVTLVLALLALSVVGLGGDDPVETIESTGGSRQAEVFDGADNLLTSATPESPSVTELARSTVRIVGLDGDDQAVCVGSGVIVDAEGMILTNAHVVTASDDGCDIETIGIAVTENTSRAPELLYRAEILITDDAADLAVLDVVGPLSSAPDAPYPRNFPPAVLGDSDQVDLGDNVRILGYPVIGGETITSTTGSVSGFSAQEGIGDRALLKTDATISAGNSGGMALNDVGEVIGIPTRARATESGPAIDCRPIDDTNEDGDVDESDICVPVGGFLNGIRPINLATELLAEAGAAREEARDETEVAPVQSFDLSSVIISNPRFSTGEEEDEPVDQILAASSGAEEICLFVDWAGIPDGVPWSAVWLVDGEEIADFGRVDAVWDFGEEGRNFWYCARDENGHKPAVFEIGLFLNEQLIFVESIRVVDGDPVAYEVTWVNRSDQDVCGLAVNPLTDSRHTGLNELGPDTVIAPGQSYTLDVSAGDIVVEALDCSGRTIAAELDGIRIPDELFVDGVEVPLIIGA